MRINNKKDSKTSILLKKEIQYNLCNLGYNAVQRNSIYWYSIIWSRSVHTVCLHNVFTTLFILTETPGHGSQTEERRMPGMSSDKSADFYLFIYLFFLAV